MGWGRGHLTPRGLNIREITPQAPKHKGVRVNAQNAAQGSRVGTGTPGRPLSAFVAHGPASLTCRSHRATLLHALPAAPTSAPANGSHAARCSGPAALPWPDDTVWHTAPAPAAPLSVHAGLGQA